ncbi:nicotinate-nucleotide adenylyltransferase [Nitrosococcus watsonii]|uniref:Probable nicotinate-nucleotide adenylyltransferase n=1 Tax=Nitrosococcus watsoni (strain C-113) TaxID=105559 RepID=D8KAA5_NITWC|nr:nicotinate-nucleotide adenylyltransferase [Nitrosococcus watsonii]ADJ27420.1 nicotinate (nicotinamide) nucleotide adenylyltransferase [Nitrosococcus watsonii C-113]
MTLHSQVLAAQSNCSAAPIGIFGGTFDPVHFGHLRPALDLLERLSLAEIRFIPCRHPPHRQWPVASSEQRLTMLRLAIAGESRFRVDERELARAGPSYMVDTLASLRAEQGNVPLCLIMGTDAFQSLPKWHRWTELMELAHLLVMRRPGEPLPRESELGDFFEARRIHDPVQLAQQPMGFILPLEVTPLGISATRIRTLIEAGGSARYLLPNVVWDYIQKECLYLPSLSTPEK